MSTLLERFARSPLARQIEADEVAAVIAQRRAAAAEIDRLEQERAINVPPLVAKEAAAVEQVERAQQSLTLAQNRLALASRARFAEGLRLDGLVNQQRAILRTTVPEPLASFLTEIRERELDAVGADPPRGDLLAEIRRARQAAEGLIETALGEAELLDRLATMRRAIATVENTP